MSQSPPASPCHASKLKPAATSPLPRVGVCLALYPDYQFGILQGVRSYLSECPGAFEFLTKDGSPYLRPADLAALRPDGVIANIQKRDVALFQAVRVPMVKIGARSMFPDLPGVEMDGGQVGRAAASHLLGLGLKSLAGVGVAKAAWSEERLDGFCAGAKACQLPVALRGLAPSDEAKIADTPALAEWLRKIPRPGGVFVVTDLLARRVVEVARAAGLNVPRDLAVLGFNNGLYECLFAEPHLSSVPQDHHRLGFAAARLLHEALTAKGRKQVPLSPVRLRAASTVRRRSTAVLAWTDPLLRECLEFFHHHLSDGAGLSELFDAYLEQRLRLIRHLDPVGNTAADSGEAGRLRLVLAEQFLRESEMSFSSVAEYSGFGEEARLRRVFLEAFGHTPADYRARFGRAVNYGPTTAS